MTIFIGTNYTTMPAHNYPDVNLYKLPKSNILVINCMDLRLTDDIVDFLRFDNLSNRYDQFILAGASLTWAAQDRLTATPSAKIDFEFKQQALEDFDCFNHWKKSLADHINLAVRLHQVKDIYIIEHQDCRAYANFLHNADFDDSEAERHCHSVFSKILADDIAANTYSHPEMGDYHLNVHTFYIDLRGNVELLHTTPGNKQ